MPIITVYGADGKKQLVLQAVLNLLKDQIAAINELEIGRHQVSVLFPSDLLLERTEKEIIAYVDLFNGKKRTLEVKNQVATTAGEVLSKAFQDATFLEVLVRGFNHEQEGYWSLRR